jgi:hypothetical protein
LPEALKVGADLPSVLVTSFAIFLQAFADDAIKPRGDIQVETDRRAPRVMNYDPQDFCVRDST